MAPQVEYIRQYKILITIYDLKEEGKKERMKHRIPRKIFIKSNSFKRGHYKAWKIGENKLLLTFRIPTSLEQNFRKTYQVFIVDLQQQTLRVPNFFLENEKMRFASTIYNMGDFSVFRVDHERENKYYSSSSTLYFVCHETESVIRKVSLSSSDSFLKLYPSTNPRNTLLFVEQKKNGKKITDLVVTKFEVQITKDHYLFLMLSIHEDFDDDLLFDAIDLLVIQA